MTRSTYLMTALALLSSAVRAHIEMVYPPGLGGLKDPYVGDNKDYNMKSPLNADGSNFPCRNHHLPPAIQDASVEWAAGSTQTVRLDGSIPHNGGSCQFSLSYDNGATFSVVKSVEGGCPVARPYNVEIPTFAPQGTSVLFAWTWFNLSGNREMYMNCARVNMTTNSTNKVHRRKKNRRVATSMTELPTIFTCNIGRGCTTIEGQFLHFPYPGDNIQTGINLIPVQPGPGFVGTPGGSAGSGSSSSSAYSTTSFGNGTSSQTTSVPTAPFQTFTTSSTSLSTSRVSSTSFSTSAISPAPSSADDVATVTVSTTITKTFTMSSTFASGTAIKC